MNKYRVTKARTTLEAVDVEAQDEAEAVAKAAELRGLLVGSSTLSSAVLLDEAPPVDEFDPTGFGTYFRRIVDNQINAQEAAARCKEAGMAWAVLMVEAVDGYTTSAEARKTYAEALRAAGLTVGVWSLPGQSRAASVEASRAAARDLTDAAKALGAAVILLNVEDAYKGKQTELRALVDTTLGTAPAGSSIGVVSYPVPSWHPDMDWAAFSSLDWASPMFYATAASQESIDRGFDEWLEIVPVVVPSLDGWSGSGLAGAARLEADIRRVCGPAYARTPSAAVWSESQMDEAKRTVTRRMAGVYGWPVGS